MARGGALIPDASAVAALAAAARSAEPRCGAVVVVAIDGPSGAGKTMLADALAADLGCPQVHLDDLYPGWDGLAEGVRRLIACVLLPWSRGEDARVRVWDWRRDAPGEERVLPAPPLVVVEGCGASVGEAGARAALRVWVDAPAPVRRARGLARDGEAFRPHWERWAAQEQRLFTADATPEKADVHVRT